MSTAYPNSLDALTNPTGSDLQGSVTVPHAAQHANANDAIEAIQAILGTSPDGGYGTVKARLTAIEAAMVVLGNNVSNAITTGSVTTAKLADGSVTTVKIADNSITPAKLQTGSVTTAKILDGNVTNSKLADSSITASKLNGLLLPLSGIFVARPSAVTVPGQIFWDTTNKTQWLSDGTGWIIMSEPVITTFAPAPFSGSGTITTLGAVTFAYHRCDGYLDWNASIAITTNGTGATNVQFSLPVAAALTANDPIGHGRESNSGKSLFVGYTAAPGGVIFNYDNTYPAANGFILRIGGKYRMTTKYS